MQRQKGEEKRKEKKNIVLGHLGVTNRRQFSGVSFLSYLKGVFCESRQAVVHVASSTRVYYYLSNLIGFTQLRWTVWLDDAHESWRCQRFVN